jgi:hypothetical protein
MPSASNSSGRQAKDRLLKRWPKLAEPMVSELADQAQAAVAAGDVAQLGELAVSAGVIAAIATPLRGSGSELAQQAAAGVVQEAAGQGVNVKAPDLPGDVRVRQTADAVAHIIASGYASGAGRAALQLAGANPVEVRAAVAEHLADLGSSSNGLVGDNVGRCSPQHNTPDGWRSSRSTGRPLRSGRGQRRVEVFPLRRGIRTSVPDSRRSPGRLSECRFSRQPVPRLPAGLTRPALPTFREEVGMEQKPRRPHVHYVWHA